MKMTLDVTISVDGADAEEILDVLLKLQREPKEPIETNVGTVGNEFLTNTVLQIDLEDHSREGGIAYRRIHYTVRHEKGRWLRDMSWNTFLIELQEPDGGKIRHIQLIGPVAIEALRAVCISANTNIGDET